MKNVKMALLFLIMKPIMDVDIAFLHWALDVRTESAKRHVETMLFRQKKAVKNHWSVLCLEMKNVMTTMILNVLNVGNYQKKLGNQY